ncbi:hypothetical protein GOE08_06790 [Sinorhizobium medicae]|nr:hypothetical protein [Sinorhizobium medicae]
MRLMKTLHRLLFVAALLGIVVGPIGIGAADGAMASSLSSASTPMADMTGTDMAGMGMADDMPCCPDEKPIKPDCGSKSCPLAVLCTTAIVGQLATSHSWSLNVGWTAHPFLIPPHAELASSLVDPPVRPPRV